MGGKCSRRKRHEEYQSMVKDKAAKAEWKYLDVNEHQQQMKNITMETAQAIHMWVVKRSMQS